MQIPLENLPGAWESGNCEAFCPTKLHVPWYQNKPLTNLLQSNGAHISPNPTKLPNETDPPAAIQ